MMHVSSQFHAVGMAIGHAERLRAQEGFNAAVVEIADRDIYVFFWKSSTQPTPDQEQTVRELEAQEADHSAMMAARFRAHRSADQEGKVGRPATLDGGKRVNVYLDAASLARAAALGKGNVSEGLRRAIEAAQPA